MTEVRDFDAEFSFKDKPGISFKLGEKEWHTKSVAPPAAFLNLESGLNAAVMFLEKVLVVEEREAFRAMIEDPDVLISAYQVDQIAAWVIEETSGRPTESPASSGNGGGRSSTGSKGKSVSVVKTGE